MLHQLAGLPTIVIVSIPSLFWEASCVSKRVDSPKSCAAKTHKYIVRHSTFSAMASCSRVLARAPLKYTGYSPPP